LPVYSAEAQKRGSGARGGRPPEEAAAMAARRLPGLAAREVASFIDGKRSVLEIYQAVRAECGNLVVGSEETKFAYVLSPDAPDVELDLVYAALEALQKNGAIEFVKAAQPVSQKPAKKK
jgi:hypothetical protein